MGRRRPRSLFQFHAFASQPYGFNGDGNDNLRFRITRAPVRKMSYIVSRGDRNERVKSEIIRLLKVLFDERRRNEKLKKKITPPCHIMRTRRTPFEIVSSKRVGYPRGTHDEQRARRPPAPLVFRSMIILFFFFSSSVYVIYVYG